MLAAIVVLLLMGSLFLTPSNAYRIAPGPVFSISDSAELPEPYTLDEDEGDWHVLTVEAYSLKMVDELLLKATGRGNQLYRAAGEGPYNDQTAEEAEASRQLALNVAMDAATGGDGLLLLEGAQDADVPDGSRLLAVNGNPPAPGQVPDGNWLVVLPDGQVTAIDVEPSQATATPDTPRPRHDPLQPLTEGPDAVSTQVFHLEEVGGSSAGLTMSLAWIDVVTDGDLSDGRSIGATGTIDADGKVAPVAGAQFKLEAAKEAGLDLVLVPAGYDGPVPEGLEVVQVSTVAEALDALAK